MIEYHIERNSRESFSPKGSHSRLGTSDWGLTHARESLVTLTLWYMISALDCVCMHVNTQCDIFMFNYLH